MANPHSINRNAMELLLLILPDELRLRAFRYAVGGDLIHISHLYYHFARQIREAEDKPHDESLCVKGVFRHSICIAGEWELEAYGKAMNGLAVITGGDNAEYHIQIGKERHKSCWFWNYLNHLRYPAERVRPAPTRVLTLLGACHQIYEEGFNITRACSKICPHDTPSTTSLAPPVGLLHSYVSASPPLRL